MFELFRQYSGEEPDQIWENLIQYIYDNRENVEKWSKNCLPTDVSLSNWLLRMTHKKNAGDEFTLYLLCKIFNWHAVIITKTGLWTTLLNVSNDGELAVCAWCDICLILIRTGNTGFGEIIRVTPSKTPTKHGRSKKTVGVSVHEAVTWNTRQAQHVMPSHRPKRKRVTVSINRLNILAENGKNHNMRATNGTRTRHTTRKLQSTYCDLNYCDLIWMHSQGIITRNRLQRMASPNARVKLIGTAMKIEDAVKEEDTVKKEPVVNTWRSDRSWLKSPKLVHLDRTPCSDECIASNHYGKAPTFQIQVLLHLLILHVVNRLLHQTRITNVRYMVNKLLL